jgi:hypothetical protein
VLVLALVWLTASFVTARRHDARRGWADDPRRLGEKTAGTLTVLTWDDEWSVTGQGSGFVVDPSGVGVTNVHVLRGAARAMAVLGDGRAYDILGIRTWRLDRDLVVFTLGRDLGDGPEWPSGLTVLQLSDGKPPRVGDWVATVTSPKGLEQTLSDGLVSAYREQDGMRYIQTTAPTSPGSSGGPLLDRRGDVVGVAVSQMSDGQNLNFAVPVDSLRPLLEVNEQLSFTQFQDRLFEADWRLTGIDRATHEEAQECMAWFEEQEYRKALRGFLELARRRPDAPYPCLMAARCCLGLDDEARAVGYYRRYLERAYPDDPTRPQIEQWLRQQARKSAGG